MEKVMGEEARELSVRGLIGVLAVLTGIMLLMNQTLQGAVQGVLDQRLVPVSKTSEAACAGIQMYVVEEGCETAGIDVDLLLAAAAVPEKTELLLKDARPHPVQKEAVSAESRLKEEGERPALMSDLAPSETEEAALLLTEVAVPGLSGVDQKEPAAVAPDHLPGTSVIVEEVVSRLPAADAAVPEEPAGMVPGQKPESAAPVEMTPPDAAAPVEVVPPESKTPVEMAPPESKAPAEVAPPESKAPVEVAPPESKAPVEVIPPAPAEPDEIVPEKPSEEPVVPEPVVPDTPAPVPGAGDALTDIVEGEGAEGLPASGFLLDEAGMLCGFQPEAAGIVDGYLELPAECTGIRSGAFLGCGAGIVEMYIPAGTAVIEEGALFGLDQLEWIEVEGGNPGYASVFGVLFDSSRSVLVKFPSGRVDVYSLPSETTAVAGGAFEGTSLSRLELRKCGFVSFMGNVFGNSAGSGMEIAVPEELYDMYAQTFSGYSVLLTK